MNEMTVNEAIKIAIFAINKIKPSNYDARHNLQYGKQYDNYMEAIRILKSLREGG